jgi:hypothetical protein
MRTGTPQCVMEYNLTRFSYASPSTTSSISPAVTPRSPLHSNSSQQITYSMPLTSTSSYRGMAPGEPPSSTLILPSYFPPRAPLFYDNIKIAMMMNQLKNLTMV